MTAEQGRTVSAGETGLAKEAASPEAEIIVGEIPSDEDPTTMLWTARCTEPTHDLLGRFENRSEAIDAGTQHLESDHRTV